MENAAVALVFVFMMIFLLGGLGVGYTLGVSDRKKDEQAAKQGSAS